MYKWSLPYFGHLWSIPGGSLLTDFGLNDPSIVQSGVSMSNRTADSASFSSPGSLSDRVYWPTFPTGTRIRFTLSYSARIYFRSGNDTTLDGPGAWDRLFDSQVTTGNGPGSVNLDITLTAATRRNFLGFNILGTNSTFRVSNLIVNYPS